VTPWRCDGTGLGGVVLGNTCAVCGVNGQNVGGLEAIGEGRSSSTVSFVHGFNRLAESQSGTATINADLVSIRSNRDIHIVSVEAAWAWLHRRIL